MWEPGAITIVTKVSLILILWNVWVNKILQYSKLTSELRWHSLQVISSSLFKKKKLIEIS